MSMDSLSNVINNYKNWNYVKFEKLVSDMDDEKFFNEKQSIRDSARSLKKYGSINSNHTKRTNDVLVKHEIDKNDTLQGIALKYGSTMEQIRRANRLLVTDSIFLRQFLMIPVDKESPYYPKDDARPHSLPPRAASTAGLISNTDDKRNNNKSMNDVSSAAITPEEESRKTMEEFLGKIDSSIATSKKYIAESQKNSEFLNTSHSDDNIFSQSSSHFGTSNSNSNYSNRAPSSSSSSTSSYQNYSQHYRQNSTGNTTSDTVNLIVMTQGRKIQNSLQRLEKQQDEFFEL